MAGAKALSARPSDQAQSQRRIVGQFWDALERAVAALSLDFKAVRLYQDGLPICGHEADIVAQLAATGSRNHRLLRGLMDRGATLSGTESGELLVEEYELLRQSLLPGIDPKKHRELSTAILAKRDVFIAKRIANTLCPGETGILFIGLMHNIEPGLTDAGIEVSYPIGKPKIRMV